MIVCLNGSNVEFEAGATVAGAVERVVEDSSRVAVEQNRAIVPRAAWNQTELTDGDVLEVVTLVGGG